MRFGRKITAIALAAAGIVAVSAVGLWGCNDEEVPAAVIDGTLIKNKMEDVSELVTTKYYYSGAGVYSSKTEGFLWFESEKSFIVAYEGEMLIGTDFTNPDIQVDSTAKKITVTLPPVKVLSHTIHENSLEVWNEDDSVFNPITLDDYAIFLSAEKEKQVENAIRFGVLDEEKEKSKLTIEKIISVIDAVSAEHYEVEVVFEPSESDSSSEQTTEETTATASS